MTPKDEVKAFIVLMMAIGMAVFASTGCLVLAHKHNQLEQRIEVLEK